MNNYTQLKLNERAKIYESKKNGLSARKIAIMLDRSPSTIIREIERNSDEIGYFFPRDAHENAYNRKARYKAKIDKNPKLKQYIVDKLQEKWSPNTIAGRWSKEHPEQSICKESIYKFIYSKEGKKHKLHILLLRKHKVRGMKRKSRSGKGIKDLVSIHERPQIIADRIEQGHFEMDLIFHQGSQSANTVVALERVSRKVFLAKNHSKNSKSTICIARNMIKDFAKTVTTDRGKEFAEHKSLEVNTYFCDPGSPWQKGSVENANGILRRYIPFSMSYDQITHQFLDEVDCKINNMPREMLGFRTPNEVFSELFNDPESRVKTALPAVEAFL